MAKKGTKGEEEEEEVASDGHVARTRLPNISTGLFCSLEIRSPGGTSVR